MTNSPQPPPSIQPEESGHHQLDADEEDENVKQLKGCSTLYLALQDCLVRTDRNWKSCQPDVQALKACHSRMMNNNNIQKKNENSLKSLTSVTNKRKKTAASIALLVLIASKLMLLLLLLALHRLRRQLYQCQ